MNRTTTGRTGRGAAHRAAVMMGGAALGASGLGAMALVGCGDDDDANGNGGGNGNGNGGDNGGGGSTPDDSGGGGGATGPVGNTQEVEGLCASKQFREMYHGRELKKLPGFEKQPQSGGTFRYAFIRPNSWDPTGAGASTLPSYAIMHNQLIRFVVRDDVENHNFQEVEADLAQSMPEQPDGLTYTFKINPGVTFHDTPPVNGRALTSEDIKYAIEVYQEAPVQSSSYGEMRSIDTPDEETVTIKTSAPAAYFLDSLVIPWHWIFSREQHEAGGMDQTPIGTGPFMLESQEDQGGYVAARNPNYWKTDSFGTQLPYWDKIDVQYIASPVDADAAFRTGEIDHRLPTNYEAWKELVNSVDPVVTQVTTPPPSAHPFIAMNLTKPPFDDVRVRRALALSVDRPALIDSLAGGMAGFGYGMDQTYFGSDGRLVPKSSAITTTTTPSRQSNSWPMPATKAASPRRWKCSTSYTSGLWFEVAVPPSTCGARSASTSTTRYSQDQSQWISRYFSKEYEDMMSVNFVGPGWSTDAFTYQALHSASPRNYFHVANDELDRLCEEQRREMDLEKRQDIAFARSWISTSTRSTACG
ncbi:MAG: ABC transporter substrate-binding protein [Dehalococcoidia bacterium]|nr:ABC transporter substrate-binding protein [Dehalococcoidia bacterium]